MHPIFRHQVLIHSFILDFKQMKLRPVKHFILPLLIIISIIPIVQLIRPFQFKWIQPLKGAVVNTSYPELSWEEWFSGSYQEQFESYFNDNIWIRPWLVRVHNQIQFSLFGKAHANGVIIGKDNYLYENNYIRAYNGEDFIGTNEIHKKIDDLKLLQDKLNSFGKTLLVVLAPGKGNFYPEYFPPERPAITTDSTNYKVYSKELIEKGINHIDFNKWFVEMKDTSQYMLYPKYGIHWSYYGMLLAADSIIKHIESDREIEMPSIELENFEISTKLRSSDYDIGKGMNLMFQMKSEPMCYPHIRIINPNNKKPKAIVISDSFYWSMFNFGMGKNIFSIGGFWYYNKQIYPDNFKNETLVQDIDMRQRILDSEVIMLMSTDANLSKFSWGFVEDANKYLNGTKFNLEDTKEFKTKVINTSKYIRTNENWMKQIEKKAKANNISVDSMITLDAIWVVKQKLKN